MSDVVWNHVPFRLSDNDMRMVRSVPPGGNWRDIPLDIPSRRLEQIRKSGGRTTLYGRLRLDQPSYTINTYLNRPGNGSHIHPVQDRVLTIREAARLQTFPDEVRFFGPKSQQLKQVGNAVPPMLARAVGLMIQEMNPTTANAVDLFAGAGGLSIGLELAGFSVIVGTDFDSSASLTYAASHKHTAFIQGDITLPETRQRVLEAAGREVIGLLAGGPPCQGFSMAGKRMLDDPRNVLFREYLAIAAALQPSVLLMENVPGLLSMEGGKTLASIREELKQLGYQSRVVQMNAVDYSCPQKRKRLFIIAAKHQHALDRINQDGYRTSPTLTVGEAIGDLPAPNLVEPIEIQQPPSTPFQAWARAQITSEQFFAGRQSTPLEAGLFD